MLSRTAYVKNGTEQHKQNGTENYNTLMTDKQQTTICRNKTQQKTILQNGTQQKNTQQHKTKQNNIPTITHNKNTTLSSAICHHAGCYSDHCHYVNTFFCYMSPRWVSLSGLYNKLIIMTYCDSHMMIIIISNACIINVQ